MSVEFLFVRIEWVYNDRLMMIKNWKIWVEKFGRVFGLGGSKINIVFFFVLIVFF